MTFLRGEQSQLTISTELAKAANPAAILSVLVEASAFASTNVTSSSLPSSTSAPAAALECRTSLGSAFRKARRIVELVFEPSSVLATAFRAFKGASVKTLVPPVRVDSSVEFPDQASQIQHIGSGAEVGSVDGGLKEREPSRAQLRSPIVLRALTA